MLNLLSDEMRRDPYPAYAAVRETSPLLFVPEADLWMIFDYDGVKRALTDHEAFSSDMTTAGRRNPEWFIFFDPPRHTRMRGLIMRAFTPRMVANLEPRIRDLSRGLLERSLTRGEMDLAEDFSIPLPMMVIAEMLGIPAVDWPRFRQWSDAILKLSYTVSGGEGAEEASSEYATATAEMSGYLDCLLAERRGGRREDLLSRLVEVEVHGERLSAQEILGFFQLLLIAGTETTTNLINNAFLCLVEHPDQLQRLRTAPDLTPSAIEEVLRYRSPVQWMMRATKRDVEMNGRIIAAGKLVLPVIGSANRDPRQFTDASRFDIARDPNPHIAFGHGIHFCIGAPLSRLEGRIALTDLLRRMKSFALAGTEPWEPRKALHVHGPTRLAIRFEADARSGVAQ